MEDGVVMHFLQSQANFLQLLHRLLFSESFAFLDESEEIATLHVLHDDVEVCDIIEESIQRDYIGVVEEELDLNLVDKLL